ncbi:unnamed protein product [Chrysoparadoxa australica]
MGNTSFSRAKANKGENVPPKVVSNGNASNEASNGSPPGPVSSMKEASKASKNLTVNEGAKELEDLRNVFSSIASEGQLSLATVMSLQEVQAQIASGDLSSDAIEKAWVGASPKEEAGATLGFPGFLKFLSNCEQHTGTAPAPAADDAAALVLARQRLLSLMRASITVHALGGLAQFDAAEGEQLHAQMVRCRLEAGLGKREEPASAGQHPHMEHGLAKKLVSQGLKKGRSKHELTDAGILLDQHPTGRELEKNIKKDMLKHELERRPSQSEMEAAGISTTTTAMEKGVEKAFLQSKLSHDLQRRPEKEDLKVAGILPAGGELPQQAHAEHAFAAANVSRQLQQRPSLDEVADSGIYRSPNTQAGKELEMEMAKNYLKQRLFSDSRPERDELEERGILHADTPTKLHAERLLAQSQVKRGLERRGSVEALQKLGILPTGPLNRRSVERGLLMRNLKHSLAEARSLDELLKEGVYVTPMQAVRKELARELARNTLKYSLDHRPELNELEGAGIYKATTAEESKAERNRLSMKLDGLLKERPGRDEMLERGLLEADALIWSFETLCGQPRSEGVVTCPELLGWEELKPVLADGTATTSDLEAAFTKIAGTSEAVDFGGFEAVLRAVPCKGAAGNLKAFVLKTLQPAYEEALGHEGMKRRQDMMAERVAALLRIQQPLSALKDRGVYDERTPKEVAAERALLTHCLSRAVDNDLRPTKAELENKGILIEAEAGALAEQHRNARNAVEGYLARRPSMADLVDEGYFESDKLEQLFLELSHDTGVMDPAALSDWSEVKEFVSSGGASAAEVKAAVAGAGLNADGKVGFVEFLAFVNALDLTVDGCDTDVEEKEGDSPEVAEHKRLVRKRRERALQAEAEQVEQATFQEKLLMNLKSRPAKEHPETQRIAKTFLSNDAVSLEQSLIRNNLTHQLQDRPSIDELADRGIYVKGPAQAKELEFLMNQRLLARRLARRPGMQELINLGIASDRPPQAQRLEHLIAGNAVKHQLEHRPSLSDLEARGIHRGSGATAATAIELAHKLSGAEVSRSLENRPSPDDLQARGILKPEGAPLSATDVDVSQLEDSLSRGPPPSVVAQRLTPSTPEGAKQAAEEAIRLHTPEEKQRLVEAGLIKNPVAVKLEHEMAHDMLKRGLEHRTDLESLKNRGVYLDQNPQAAKLEKELIRNSIKRKLDSPMRPTKDDLKNQGVYQESGGTVRDVERALLLRTLKHNLGERSSVDALKSRGIYMEGSTDHHLHERLLRSALLAKGLSHHSPETLEELKQKGIYIDSKAELMGAERNLVLSQLNRLLQKRPSVEDITAASPSVLEPNELALVFEECIVGDIPRVTFAALKSWSSVDEYIKQGGDGAEQQLASRFDSCDLDKDGSITFSEFLHWVELCDLEGPVEMSDEDLAQAFTTLAQGQEQLGLEEINTYAPVRRWATQANLDHKALEALMGGPDVKADAPGFVAFCRQCESAAAAAETARKAELREEADGAQAEAKSSLKALLVQKLRDRPDYEELREQRIVQGGIGPAAMHLERNLVSNYLKQQLAQRPTLEALEQQGIILPEEVGQAHQEAASKVEQALEMRHDDAKWRMDHSQLEGGSREAVKKALERKLSARAPPPDAAAASESSAPAAYYAVLLRELVRVSSRFGATAQELCQIADTK